MGNSRRDFLKQSATLAAFSAARLTPSGSQSRPDPDDPLEQNPNWPIEEGPDTPKLSMARSSDPDESEIRRIKQLGVTYITTGGPQIPWNVKDVRQIIDRYKAADMHIANLYMGFRKVITGEEGRDKELDHIKESIRVAGKVGIPVVEYNWFAHRLVEGYYAVEGRGGAGYTGFDYSRVKDLPPKEGEKAFSSQELWDNYEYFLKEVIPVAEKAGVRMAVHPNDPPAAISRRSEEILVTFDDYKRLVNLVDSPSNGMTCHPGFYAEIGIDGLEVIRYLGERDRINHCHYRNVRVQKPSRKYVEVFPDNGEVDMLAMMRELIRQGYTWSIGPEHPRALDYDREHPDGLTAYADVGGGGYTGRAYNIAYARAMMQAALEVESKV